MKLSIQQQAIKIYIDKAHARGHKPSIKEVAKAFKITPDQVRSALKTIKANTPPKFYGDPGIMDMFYGIFK